MPCSGKQHCIAGEIRTKDHLVMSLELYQLNYNAPLFCLHMVFLSEIFWFWHLRTALDNHCTIFCHFWVSVNSEELFYNLYSLENVISEPQTITVVCK